MLAGWDYVTLQGTILKTNDEPEVGVLEFSPTSRLIAPNGDLCIEMVPFYVQLLSDGSFSVPLLATDNLLYIPATWSWRMHLRLENIDTTRYLTLPASIPVVNYADMEIP